jgi:hypothetical protein
MTTTTEPVAAHGFEVLIPLNKLKKSLHNARKAPHAEAAIAALAASIAHKGWSTRGERTRGWSTRGEIAARRTASATLDVRCRTAATGRT